MIINSYLKGKYINRKLIDGLEYGLKYGKHTYCYLANNNKLVKYIKRKMNKRYRREGKKQIYEQLKDIT